MSDKIKPTSFRLKPELKAWLTSRARAADRSLNKEMNRLLRQAKEAEEQQQTA